MEEYLKQLGISKLGENEVILINYVDMLMSAKIEGDLTNLKANEDIDVSIQVRENTDKSEEEPKYQDTMTNEIGRIIEYINSSNII